MNALTKFRASLWDPFKELQEFEQRLASRFGQLAKPNGDGAEVMATADWSPIVDITEDEKEYLVKAEIPGMKKEEVKVTVEDGVLTISGERKAEKEEKTKKYHRIERSYGKFERSFSLPENVDPTKVTAEHKEGLLQVRLPKTEKTPNKAVEVKIA
jgi:HSP20 family protein